MRPVNVYTAEPRHRVTRRDLLKRALLLGITLSSSGTLLAACRREPAAAPTPAPPAPATPAPATPAPAGTPQVGAAPVVTLDFTIWTFDRESVQGYIEGWQEANGGKYTARLSDIDWGQYHDTMVANFVAGNMPDIMYVSDHWLAEWASAGWLVPLKDVFPAEEVDKLAEGMFPYAIAGMTFEDQLYGLPYYADPIGFIYNTRHYKEAGIDKDPETWDDVLEHARTIKQKGIAQYPIGFGWSQDEPFSIEVVTAMLMSRGEEFFDDNLDPTFLKPNSTLEQHIRWVKTALDEGLMNPESLQRDGVADGQAMMAGVQTYGMTRASGMAQWQTSTESAEAGNFKLIPNPGETHQTLGFVRFYGVTKKLAERDQTAKEAGWSFMYYFAGPGPNGDWPVVKAWVRKWGLGFGPMELFQDPEVRELFGKWTDVDVLEQIAKTARARKLTPWYPSWDVFTRAELQRAYLGQVSVEEAIKNIADQWEQLRKEFEG
ncbi:putative arabinose-binding protein [bacterium HR26]|nr:putative arabinose-binding protein [bacterium HR26]